jgi:hypothetical protein
VKALLITTALAAGFALPSMAQDAPASPFQTEATGPSVSASDVIGARIYASEAALDADAYAGVEEGWDDIGEVNDIVLGRDGTVDAVLIDIGGFLGMGERQVAVDMTALRFVQDDATDADDWFLVLQADRATLDSAPEWVAPGVDTQADAGLDAGADPATNVPAVDEAMGDQAAATPDADAAPGTMEDPAAAETMTEDPLTEQAATEAPATEAPATEGTLALPDGYMEVANEELTAETLTGANVHDATDASIAEVSDLVLTEDGQVTDVVLDVGGFLGIGARTVAIPMDRLTVARTEAGDVTLWVDMTKDELEMLPEYTM